MKLLEYEAKQLLERAGLAVPRGTVVAATGTTVPDSAFPVVVKSQVPTGGRGKLGGVRTVQARADYPVIAAAVATQTINGFQPKTLLIEEALAIDKEFYLSLLINRATATIELIAHPEGGVEVESHQNFLKKPLTGSNAAEVGEALAELYGIEDKSFLLAEWVEKLYYCFIANDATLIEINPLILTTSDELVAGDCKMTLDDAAAFRHPEWDFEEKITSSNFVSLDQNGTIGTVANGAGLAMATVDAIAASGRTPANFLDIGGGATVESIGKSFQQMMAFQNLKAIVINIFGGIVRCDQVAEAIVIASEQIADLPPLFICLSGNKSEEAARILADHHLTLYPELDSCLEELPA